MNKSTFKIAKMDCPSEEGIIKMKLQGRDAIRAMEFDIPNRQLVVFHTGENTQIHADLDSLNFGTSLISTESVGDFVATDNAAAERRLLWQVLGINAFFFVLEVLAGFLAHSMGLVADGLDMLADSIVYGLALFAVGGTVTRKNNIAKLSGYFQLLLAVLGLAEVLRRFMGVGDVPAFQTMIIISVLALIGNALCLYLLQKSKSKDSHMRASMIFTSNDVIVNIGVIVAGGLVYITDSKIPDLITGIIVFALVGIGAFRILKLAN
jgi:Co/Zn/Cd efflux system component